MGAVVHKIDQAYTKRMAQVRAEKAMVQTLVQAEQPGPIKAELIQKLQTLEARLEHKSSVTSHLKGELFRVSNQ